MAAPRGNLPPPYAPTHEMQDPGEYMYPGDTNILIQQDQRGGKNEPSAPYGPVSTNNWPPEGGYVHNMQSGPYPQPVRREGIVVRQNNSNAVNTYIRWRVCICAVIILVKIVIIGIALGVIYGSRN